MADIQKIYDLIGEEKFKPQATIEERVTAIEEALQEKPMELIETVSADEPIANLSRDTEPDGKKYDFSRIRIILESPESDRNENIYFSLNGGGDFDWRKLAGTFRIAPGEEMKAILDAEVRNGKLSSIGGYVSGTRVNNSVLRVPSIPGENIAQADFNTIDGFVVEGTLLAGTVVHIYAVRRRLLTCLQKKK